MLYCFVFLNSFVFLTLFRLIHTVKEEREERNITWGLGWSGGGELFTCPYPLKVQVSLTCDHRPALWSTVSAHCIFCVFCVFCGFFIIIYFFVTCTFIASCYSTLGCLSRTEG